MDLSIGQPAEAPLSAIDISGRKFLATFTATPGSRLCSYTLGGGAGGFMDVRKDGRQRHLAENCSIGLGAVPAPHLFPERSIPARGGAFSRHFPHARVVVPTSAPTFPQ